MYDGLNKRRFARAHYCCIVHVLHEGGEDVIKTETENIGIGGIGVFLASELNLFTQVRVEIFLDDDQDKINCRGSVVWVLQRKDRPQKDYYTGIEFIDITDDDRERIKKIVHKILD